MKFRGLLIRSTITAALGGLLFGFDTAVIAGCTHQVKLLFGLSESMLGFMVASALIGTILGSIFIGKPGDAYGRRICLKVTGVLFLISALGCAIAWDLPSLVFFRLIGGLGVGGASVLGPMYIAEISPAKLRGRLVGFFQFNVVVGILAAYLSNYLTDVLAVNGMAWRIKFGIEAVPATLFLVMLFTIPRSPRWLIKRGKIEEAESTLDAIGEENVKQEMQEIVDSLGHKHPTSREKLFQWKYRLPIFLAITIAAFNQLAGINALLYYLNDIFREAGFNTVSSNIQAVAIGLTNLIFTVIAMSLIDKIGRRKLLLTGSLGTAATLGGVTYVFMTGQNQHLLVWLLIAYIGFFAFSSGACIWVYISEVFPNKVRGRGQALGSFTHWGLCAVVSWTFPIVAKISSGYPFMFFTAMMILQFFVVLFIYPETRGVSLEELQGKLGISEDA
ncbi:sugar porter family MFS transporter [Lentisphaerota bacterium ZTH]|nr:sugar porter family MFS transporter [Lentisphaerota bacterium]WET07212.1 sugar porter family MFS transporter [Lentisphaerota bacterium ZTH]